MQRSTGLFGELNDGIVSSAGFVSRNRPAESFELPVNPIRSALVLAISQRMMRFPKNSHVDFYRSHLVTLGNLDSVNLCVKKGTKRITYSTADSTAGFNDGHIVGLLE